MTSESLSTLSPAALLRVRLRNGDVLRAAAAVFWAANAIFGAWIGVGAGLGLAANALVCLGGALGLFVVFTETGGPLLRAPADPRALGLCLLAAFVLCVVGGGGHLLFSPFDFLIRDAVLSDVVRQGLPGFYRHEGVDYLLRAPLGMYMIPAVIGRLFGLQAAHITTLVQNALLYGAILYCLSILVKRERLRFFVLFAFFGSVDVIPRFLLDYAEWRATGHLELSPNLMFWTPNPYFGHVASLFWTPNHALSGWFFGVLILLHIDDEIDVATLGFAFCALLFWSPLSMMGATPFLLLSGFLAVRKGVVWRRLVPAGAASLCLFPIVLYLQADSGAIQRGWAFRDANFPSYYVLALLFSIPQIWLVIAARRLLDQKYRPTAALAIAMLAFLPFYKLGVTPNNDMTMRVSIAPLFLLGFFFCRTAHDLLAEGAVLRFATAAVIGLSALTGMFEIRRGLTDPAYAPSDCNILTVHQKIMRAGDGWIFPSNYLARLSEVPSWMAAERKPPATLEDRACWPDYSLLPARNR